MKSIIQVIIVALSSLTLTSGQTVDTINRTDKNGLRQGYWIQKYPGGNRRYEGYFKDNHPIGVFKRYYETDTIQSMLFYSDNGSKADAIFFHPNGFIAAAGKYIDQKREGKWEFFSSIIRGYKVSEEEYHNNMKNGFSIKYYPDKIIAEKRNYINDVIQGESLQYHENGNIYIRSHYINGLLDGKFEVWDKKGNMICTGDYKNDRRNGTWYIYNTDGSVKEKINYVNGLATNPELYIRENRLLDSLEINGRKLSDPEKTGTIWQ